MKSLSLPGGLVAIPLISAAILVLAVDADQYSGASRGEMGGVWIGR